jgi:hypothetical protein
MELLLRLGHPQTLVQVVVVGVEGLGPAREELPNRYLELVGRKLALDRNGSRISGRERNTGLPGWSGTGLPAWSRFRKLARSQAYLRELGLSPARELALEQRFELGLPRLALLRALQAERLRDSLAFL